MHVQISVQIDIIKDILKKKNDVKFAYNIMIINVCIQF